MDTLWDVSAVIAIGVVTAAVVVRHFMRTFSRTRAPGCGGGCCGGSKRPDGSGGCS
jgi:hypothetical protein